MCKPPSSRMKCAVCVLCQKSFFFVSSQVIPVSPIVALSLLLPSPVLFGRRTLHRFPSPTVPPSHNTSHTHAVRAKFFYYFACVYLLKVAFQKQQRQSNDLLRWPRKEERLCPAPVWLPLSMITPIGLKERIKEEKEEMNPGNCRLNNDIFVSCVCESDRVMCRP